MWLQNTQQSSEASKESLLRNGKAHEILAIAGAPEASAVDPYRMRVVDDVTNACTTANSPPMLATIMWKGMAASNGTILSIHVLLHGGSEKFNSM